MTSSAPLLDNPEARVAEWRDVDEATFEREIVPRYKPAILRGFVSHWPAVKAAAASPEALCTYLTRFDVRRPIQTFVGPPEIEGRFFYNHDLSGFNFRPVMV